MKINEKLTKDIEDKIDSKFDELDEKLSPVLLYENTAGTKSNNITLSDSAANYEYLEFFCDYNAENSRLISTKAYNPDGKTVNFTISESYSSGSSRYFYVWTSTVEVSGSTITQGNAGQIQFINQTINANNSSSYIYIIRVLGYKKLED